MVDIGKIVGELRFTAGPVERIYLNDDSAKTHFVGSYGAIAEWVATTSRTAEGTVSLGFLGMKGSDDRGSQLSFDIKDPLAQSLILQTSLAEQHLLKDPFSANLGEYVLVTGPGCLRHPDVNPPGDWHAEGCVPTDALEARRAGSEAFHAAFGGYRPVWLLTILTPSGPVAATTDAKWLDDRGIPRFFHRGWSLFGTVEDRIEKTPLIAPISVLMHLATR